MLSNKELEVLNQIENSRNELIGLLQTLIGYHTVAPGVGEYVDHEEYIKHQTFVSNFLEKVDFETEIWDLDPKSLPDFAGSGVMRDRDCRNMPIVTGTRTGAGSGRSLLLNGHYDVVVPGDEDEWNSHPFEGAVQDGKVYGRGAVDMKGGISAMLHALKCITECGVRVNGNLVVEIVPEEEVSEMGTLACCSKGITADAAIIPEPTNMNVLVAMRGSICGKVTITGRAGHAAMKQPHWAAGGAVNAITKTMKILQAFDELNDDWRERPDKQHGLLPPDIIVPSVLHGGDYWERYPEKVELTFSASFIGTKGNIGEIERKIRLVSENDPWLREHPPEIEYVWTYGAEIAGEEEIVQTALQAGQALGLNPQLAGMGSQTDAIHLINHAHVPTISIGPDDYTAHMANEFVEIEQLVNTAKILAITVMRWCGYTEN